MRKIRSLNRLGLGVAALAVVTVLASCGGGSSDNGMQAPPVATTPSNMPPASASATPEGFIAFLKILVPMQPDSALPLDLTGFVAPTSDTSPPDPLT